MSSWGDDSDQRNAGKEENIAGILSKKEVDVLHELLDTWGRSRNFSLLGCILKNYSIQEDQS